MIEKSITIERSLFFSGYPIFVSPLITSYSSTSQPLNAIVGSELSWDLIHKKFSAFFRRYELKLMNFELCGFLFFLVHIISFYRIAWEMPQVRMNLFS